MRNCANPPTFYRLLAKRGFRKQHTEPYKQFMVSHTILKDCTEFHTPTFSPRISPEFHNEQRKSGYIWCNRLIFSVDQPGLEPGTSRLCVCCSNQLSYKSKFPIPISFSLSISALIGCKGTLFPLKIQIFSPKDTKLVVHLWQWYWFWVPLHPWKRSSFQKM